MRKRIIRALLALAALAFCLVMLWPLSFASLLQDDVDPQFMNPDMQIRITELTIENGEAGQVVSGYDLPPGSEAYAAIEEILGRYSYHRTLRTLFSGGGPINSSGTLVNLYSGFNSFTLGGTHEAIVNSHVYQVGYVGYGPSISMIEEIVTALEDVPPDETDSM